MEVDLSSWAAIFLAAGCIAGLTESFLHFFSSQTGLEAGQSAEDARPARDHSPLDAKDGQPQQAPACLDCEQVPEPTTPSGVEALRTTQPWPWQDCTSICTPK